MQSLDVYINQAIEFALHFSPRLMLAIIVLVFGFWVAKKMSVVVSDVLKTSNVQSRELQSFLGSIVNIGLKILVIITVAGIVGIETTSFVGVIASMGFAVGLALQGNLSNFAAGVMILIMRPFKVGDEIVTSEIRGFVKEIQIFHTIVGQLDNTVMIIPNSVILNNPIKNSSVRTDRRINTKFNIPYTEDFMKVKKLIVEACYNVPEVDNSKRPYIYINEFNEFSIQISASFATHENMYWQALVNVREAIMLTLQEHKIQVVYPEGATIGYMGSNEMKNI